MFVFFSPFKISSQKEVYIPSIVQQQYEQGKLTFKQCKDYGLDYYAMKGQKNYQNKQNNKYDNNQVHGRDLQAAYAKIWKDYSMLSVPPKQVLYSKENMLESQIDNIIDVKTEIIDQYQYQQFQPIQKFTDIKNINSTLLQNLIDEDKCNYQTVLPVQQQSIPIALQNRDLKVQSNTGSGKTNAFLIPIIQKVIEIKHKQQNNKQIKALILLPTRELAQQTIFNTFKLINETDVTACVLYGSYGQENFNSEMLRNVRNQPDILVSCPGKLIWLYFQAKKVSLSGVQIVVIDEADKCFDMGFEDDLKKILNETDMPQNKQILMYSATFNQRIQKLCDEQLKEPVFLKIQQQHNEQQIQQELVNVNYDTKYDELLKIIDEQLEKQLPINQIVVFCNEKKQAEDLYSCLQDEDIYQNLYQLHGDIDQKIRTENINNFKKQKQSILICTDACQRGLDFPGVQLVINFTCPMNIDSYTHRIGRTGRVGRCGRAITFIDSDKEENRTVVNYIKDQIEGKQNNHNRTQRYNNHNSRDNQNNYNRFNKNNYRRRNNQQYQKQKQQDKKTDEEEIVIEIEPSN